MKIPTNIGSKWLQQSLSKINKLLKQHYWRNDSSISTELLHSFKNSMYPSSLKDNFKIKTIFLKIYQTYLTSSIYHFKNKTSTI